MYAGCFLVPLPEGIITQITAGVRKRRAKLESRTLLQFEPVTLLPATNFGTIPGWPLRCCTHDENGFHRMLLIECGSVLLAVMIAFIFPTVGRRRWGTLERGFVGFA